jgi:hypothetical protein
MSMIPHPIDEQDCQQDTVRRLNMWLNALEERVIQLLRDSDPQEMKPAERELAVSRHLTLMLRFMQLRQKCAMDTASPGEQALLEAILKGLEED